MARRRGPRRRGDRNRSTCEWVGGRLSSPFYVEDGGERYRAELVLWMEKPSGLIVGQTAIAPGDAAGSVAGVLRAALKRPAAGPRRRPDTIRVADASIATEVREAVGDAIPVEVAPTPELDAFMEVMLASMADADGEASYLEGGRLSPPAVARLFTWARALYWAAPWKVATDNQVLRMDIPALDVEGACVSIIGNRGESLGLIVFPDLAGYEAFVRATEKSLPEEGRPDLGTSWLALNFEREADLPASMRSEVAAHGWSIAGPDAYPRVQHREHDCTLRPLVERDLRIASTCASSFVSFFARHRKLFEAETCEPVCESYVVDDGLEVRFTLPYHAFSLFDLDAGPERPQTPPAPGSRGRAERRGRDDRDARHELDESLVRALSDFAMARFGIEWRGFTEDFVDAAQAFQLSTPWSVYHYRVQGTTVLERYLAEQGSRLSPTERTWLDAQRASWLSVWEVLEVEPGAGVTLRDLLSHERRRVREASASQALVARDTLLARIVEHEDVSLLCGLHPRPLPPFDAAEVERRARRRLRRKRAVPVERLRDEAFGRHLIRSWEQAVAELDERCARPPELRNTDGDPLLLTTDHFEIAPGTRPAVETRIAALEDVEPPDDGEDPSVYVFLRPGSPQHPSWENTVIGHGRLSEETLRLETNSIRRADALRKRVEAACGERIRRRGRTHADLMSLGPPAEGDLEPPLPEAEELLLEFKQRHYADWADQPLPALDGRTPREAARTAGGRATVDLVLRDMENREQRSAGRAAFDFSEIRRKLRLR